MDTKTPPISQKQQQQHLERIKFKTSGSSAGVGGSVARQIQVSLPPLSPVRNRRQRLKTPGSPWARGSISSTPGIYGVNNNYQTERPYRVLHLGATPLMHACQQADRSRVLRLLKDQRDTIGYRDRTLRSALHYCMDAGSGGAVAMAAPELVNAPDAEGHTPLHLAVIAGDSQLVAVLLANGADVNAKDLEGHSVLHWATVCGEVECVRLVLAAGGRPSTPDMRGGSPLHYAAQCCGAASPTELAVPKKVGLKVLQSLLDYGANCNAKDEDGRQPILWAASAGSVEAVLALARAGGSAAAGASDKDGLTALHCAASRGHAACVEALVNFCGSQPDHVDDNGCSALHYAATLGHADATALLLRLGADPNRQDRKGRTPALCAAAKGQLETLKLLAQHGGSLYARTVRGSGIAHESAASGRVELIKWLAKKRPGILDTATHDGRTPLHVAALHGHVDACKVLLDNGARVNAILRTTKGSQMTALDAALYRGHRDCAKLIQMHGGVTAQHVKSRKSLSHKEFAAKLRLKRRETSSESDIETPRRRRRRRRGSRSGPEHLYYEEKWGERSSTRRRRSDHEESRSYSDQDELRSSKRRDSKSRSRNRGQRRARSESARYEDSCSGEELKKRSKKSSKRKSKARKHEYNESTTESDSYEESKTKIQREKYSEEGSPVASDDPTVSDDSLEVVIVKKSVEKTSERVEMSGRKPRHIPRGDKSSVVMSKKTKSRRRTVRKKSREQSEAPINSEEKTKSGNKPEAHKTAIRSSKSLRINVEDELPLNETHKMQYQNETADSTSQEAVERVTVTAMVHKDQLSDTSKNASTESSPGNGETAKNEGPGASQQPSVAAEKELPDEPRKRTRPKSARPGSSRSRVPSARTRMDHILEKADEMQSALVQKAADLKKGIEEMREHISGDKIDSHESTDERKKSNDRDFETEKHRDEESDDVVTHRKEKFGEELGLEQKVDEVIDENIRESETESQSKDLDIINGKSDKLEQEKKGDSTQKPKLSHGDEEDRGEDAEAGISSEERVSLVEASRSSLVDESSSEILSPNVRSPEKEESIESKSVAAANMDEKVLVDGRSSSRKSLQSTKSSNSKSRRSSIAKDKSIASPIERKSSHSDSRLSKSRSGSSPKSDSGKRTNSENSGKDISDEKPLDTEKEDGNESRKTSMEGRSDEEQQDKVEAKAVSSARKKSDSSFKATTKLHSMEFSKGDFNADSEQAQILKNEEGSTSRQASRGSDPKSDRSRSQSRPSTAKQRAGSSSSTPISPSKKRSLQHGTSSSIESSPTRTTAIVAVIESPEWPEEDEEQGEEEEEEEEEEAIDNEIRDAIGDYPEPDTDVDENSVGVMRVLPSTSDEETPRTVGFPRISGIDSLPQVAPRPRRRMLGVLQSPVKEDQRDKRERPRTRNRRDSGGRDSGIEPSPRISKIPKRTAKCYPNTEKQQALHMETVTRDVQISLRRYHLERKIFFQLMELKRLQIRHGRANENVLVKRQVEAFHRAGTSGPTLGVAKYDQALTFRDFEAFLYEQLRRLQRRPATPDWCTGAKQCTQKTHRCHHATSAYTSLPVYTYLGVGDRGGNLLPNIEGKGKGQMTVEVTHGEDKQVIALPAEKLDRSKRYFVTFTVRGESQSREKTTNDKNSQLSESQRNAKSV